jgi:glycyl-tRNA synthetase alpha subunit
MFLEISTIWFNGQSSKYEDAGIVAINLSAISKITSFAWKDSKGNNHSYKEIWLKGETHQDTLKVSVNKWDDIKEHFKTTKER